MGVDVRVAVGNQVLRFSLVSAVNSDECMKSTGSFSVDRFL